VKKKKKKKKLTACCLMAMQQSCFAPCAPAGAVQKQQQQQQQQQQRLLLAAAASSAHQPLRALSKTQHQICHHPAATRCCFPAIDTAKLAPTFLVRATLRADRQSKCVVEQDVGGELKGYWQPVQTCNSNQVCVCVCLSLSLSLFFFFFFRVCLSLCNSVLHMETHHKRKEEQWDRNKVYLCEMKQNSMAWRRKWGRIFFATRIQNLLQNCVVRRAHSSQIARKGTAASHVVGKGTASPQVVGNGTA
jgi:hypothetical protein